MLPSVGWSSSIKLYRPIRIVPTDQIGFQLSGWKSDMDMQRRVAILNLPEGVIICMLCSEAMRNKVEKVRR
jgi:hypothetical protein